MLYTLITSVGPSVRSISQCSRFVLKLPSTRSSFLHSTSCSQDFHRVSPLFRSFLIRSSPHLCREAIPQKQLHVLWVRCKLITGGLGGAPAESASFASRPLGIPVREFPGIRHVKNSRREFPGITKISNFSYFLLWINCESSLAWKLISPFLRI